MRRRGTTRRRRSRRGCSARAGAWYTAEQDVDDSDAAHRAGARAGLRERSLAIRPSVDRDRPRAATSAATSALAASDAHKNLHHALRRRRLRRNRRRRPERRRSRAPRPRPLLRPSAWRALLAEVCGLPRTSCRRACGSYRRAARRRRGRPTVSGRWDPGVADGPPPRPTIARPLTEVLSIPDIQFVVAHFLLSRAELVRLRCASRTLRRLVDGSAALGYLGLFRTPFGAEPGCRLQPHQLRSLRHMAAAENPTGWRFGELRGGVLADDPGLGKTVTAWRSWCAHRRRREFPARLGAILRRLPLLDTGALGRRSSMPAEHRGRLDPAADQPRRPPLLLRVLTRSRASSTRRPTRPPRPQFAPYLNPVGLRDFEGRALLSPLPGGDPRSESSDARLVFARSTAGSARRWGRGAAADGACARMSEPARLALNEVRAADKSNRAFYARDRQACDV